MAMSMPSLVSRWSARKARAYSFCGTGSASKYPHAQSNCAISTLGSVVCGENDVSVMIL
jgi:hypothetical protein